MSLRQWNIPRPHFHHCASQLVWKGYCLPLPETKNICCYCSQKPLSLIHLSRVHFSKQPDLWLYVHCQTLVSLSCSLRFFLACLPCQSNVSLSHVTHDLWHQQMRLYLHDDEVVFLFTLQKACFYVLGGMPVMDKLAVIWNFHHF